MNHETLFTINRNNYSIDFYRMDNGTITTGAKIEFIKMIRDFTFCGLRDGKDFCDNFIWDLNKIQPSKDWIESSIKDSLVNMTEDQLIKLKHFINQL
jgi:hypothetical protein